ncbi:MAG: glycosyltransferase family 2 protein [Fibrobacter sp.]|nr:glycosyltransferase family 2 protein [Fibrobacter sp.]
MQQGVDFSQLQLIFIDQEDNKSAFDNLNPLIKFTYVKTEHCSLSHARNLGLSLVEGKFVCFPDDDCWYEPDTLKKALAVLQEGVYQAVSGKGMNEQGVLTSVFPSKEAEITAVKRCAAISYTMFYKYEKSVTFDECMGIGSPYNLGAGEETDYMLTLMEQFKFRVLYKPELIVHHPTQTDVYDKPYLLKKFYSYSRGGGFLMQKHQFPLSYKLRQYGRPFAGMFVHFLKGDFFGSKKSFFMFKGKLEGFFFKVPFDGK